jgi:hypothetical protein
MTKIKLSRKRRRRPGGDRENVRKKCRLSKRCRCREGRTGKNRENRIIKFVIWNLEFLMNFSISKWQKLKAYSVR